MRRDGTNAGALTKREARTTAILGRAIVTAIVIVTGVFLGISATVALPAQAEVPKLISYGNFSDEGDPFGVAVNQSTSDVYVAGFANFSTGALGQINQFNASGELLSPSPFGEGRYISTAVNPTNGNLYVFDNVLEASEAGYETRIDTYDPSSGTLLSSFPVPGPHNFFFGNFTTAQIATDSAGNVYVPVTVENKVLEYGPNGTLLETFTGSGTGALKQPMGVAVDSTGNVWVADTANNRIEELSPTGAFVGEIKSEGVQTIALDTHGDVFALVENGADFCGSLHTPCVHIVEYSSTGTQLADIGAGSIGEEAEGPIRFFNSLAVNDSNGRVYVTDTDKSTIWIYGPPSVPTLGKELVAEVSPSEAKLGALINPGGIGTSYHFEYGTTAAYGQTTPFPNGNVGQGVTARTVWASASGLEPGTTYHYRVIATNALGTVTGPDQTFTTETSQETACPNEQLRGGFSANLPDCRAYELVTPPNKASTQPDDTIVYYAKPGPQNLAASEGNRFAYESLEVLPGSDSGGFEYVSTRGASGWSPESVLPRQSYTADRCTTADAGVEAYSLDLSRAIVGEGGNETQGEGTSIQAGCGAEQVEVVGGEPHGFKNLLLRDNEDGTYQLINVTPPGVAPANAYFVDASSDLSRICFSEHAQLTPGAPAGVDNEYEWSGGTVRLVTASAPAECLGGTLPSKNEAAGYSYFVSTSVLTSSEANEHGEVAESGQSNLYLSHGGATTFIATLEEADFCVGEAVCTRVSPNGAFFTFVTRKSLTGYDNTDASTGSPDREIFLYSAASKRLVCASCNPSGEAPAASGVEMRGFGRQGAPHYLSDGGRLFFETAEGLLPSDTNGQDDVYEYEGGQLHLISTGTSSKESVFLDASENGDDVFFVTRQKLLPRDTNEEALSIYDARVDGGFAETASPPACTTADSCRAAPVPQPAIFGAPSSATFSGAGNLASPTAAAPRAKPKSKAAKCKKGFVKKRDRCVKKLRKKAKKSAHVNKRTGK